MTLVSNPNGLLIASALFALSGLAILARALFESYAPLDEAAPSRSQNKIAALFGAPLIAIGLFLNGAGQFASGPMGAGLTCLLLSLAFALLLYAMSVGSFDDNTAANIASAGVAADAPPRLLVPPPKLIAVEATADDKSASDTSRQALPA